MLQWANYQKDKICVGKSPFEFFFIPCTWQEYLKQILSKKEIILYLIYHSVIIPIDYSDSVIVKVISTSTK